MSLLILPKELIYDILALIQYNDIINVCCSNKYLYSLSDDNIFWKNKYLEDFKYKYFSLCNIIESTFLDDNWEIKYKYLQYKKCEYERIIKFLIEIRNIIVEICQIQQVMDNCKDKDMMIRSISFLYTSMRIHVIISRIINIENEYENFKVKLMNFTIQYEDTCIEIIDWMQKMRNKDNFIKFVDNKFIYKIYSDINSYINDFYLKLYR
ncbi:F-box domain-containing protein [Orpheovirus IHUMI-LCC2]|uniref:F-box domain-containing protein n=1 Tax=Orpheovirus IHUMI-LCC2 TaxID=2023057 RepID=A0A2I2L3I7_9VIRU|nr:F-box domain-containing protein [Orpheovirus IHUMI-LCC2]SNW62102.1 F-box domain-containing protein [Orpheovirus IHUMI-LCC2]